MLPSALPAKRKRAQVCYTEPDDFADLERQTADEADAVDEVEEVAESSDDDYSPKQRGKKSRPKAKKRKTTPNKAIKPRQQKPFPFLDLPAELRDYIYDLALCDPGGLRIVSKIKQYRRTVCRGLFETDHSFDGNFHQRGGRHYRTGRRLLQSQPSSETQQNWRITSPDTLVPNLLAVNKQIHAEGTSMLYTQPILVSDTMALHQFLAAIGPNNMKLLRDITICGWGGGRGAHKAMNHCALTLLSGATSLQSLTLNCLVGTWGPAPTNLARQIYRDGHYFMEAMGAWHKKKDAGVDILVLDEENCNPHRRRRYYDISQDNTTEGQAAAREKFMNDFQAELRRLLLR